MTVGIGGAVVLQTSFKNISKIYNNNIFFISSPKIDAHFFAGVSTLMAWRSLFLVLCKRYSLCCDVCDSVCTGFGWEQDGSTLCAISNKSSIVFLWDANAQRVGQIDSGFR